MYLSSSQLLIIATKYVAASGNPALVRKLADYAIARHYSDAAEAENPYLEFYRRWSRPPSTDGPQSYSARVVVPRAL